MSESPDRVTLGVDPGPAAGAAVRLWPGGYVWVAWQHSGRGRARQVEVTTDRHDDVPQKAVQRSEHPGCPGAARPAVLAGSPDVVAIEALHTGKVRGRQIVQLAEDAGTWIGDALSLGLVPLRPSAQAWRLALGIAAGTKARTADAMARRLLVERYGLTWLADAPGHVVDAAGIAVWAREVS